MRIGYNWLREFVEIELDPAGLAERLTMFGFPVSSVGPSEPEYPGIITGQVDNVRKHPRADRLVLCEVSTGERNLRIVCGAPNVTEGMKVAVATPGAVLAGETKIERVTVRGEVSEGMLCSGAELRLSDDATGIIELPENTVCGMSLDEHLGIAETVLDLEISHNRSDCLSVFGLAREVAALSGVSVRFPEVVRDRDRSPVEEDLEVGIEEATDCPRYCGLVVSEVRVGPSPPWLRSRLQIAGFRAVNNVVDATNYCLACFGQPIHAFDYDRMKRKSILVRRATRGERIVTLDGTQRQLNPEVLLITDGRDPLAIAGVMGGRDTEVMDTSSRLLLESAHFAPQVVKHGSRVCGLESEASVRFSRGTDPEMPARCLEYVSSLIGSLTGAVCSGKIKDCYPGRRPEAELRVKPERVARVLGGSVSSSFMEERLVRLGFGWDAMEDGVDVSVPSFRYDVHEEVDIVEEVARSFGYDKFAERAANLSWVAGVEEEQEAFLDECRDCLISLGLNEAITKVLVDPKKAGQFLGEAEARELVWLSNPVSLAEAVLRPFVLCSLLEAVGINLRRGGDSIRLFEIGKTFRSSGGGLPSERFVVAGAVCGRKWPLSWQRGQPAVCDLFDSKGFVEGLLGKLKVDSYKVLCYDGLVLEREASGSIRCNGKTLGLFGSVSRELLRTFDIERDVYVFELDIDVLRKVSRAQVRFVEPSRFPPVKRDLAVIVEETLPQAEVAEFIVGLAGEHLQRAELFDVYAGKAIPEGKKSLAYSLSFQSVQRTLSDRDVDRIMERVIEGLKARGADIRGRPRNAN